jgi:hypothetical protein
MMKLYQKAEKKKGNTRSPQSSMKPGLSLWQVLREDDEDAKNKAEGKELGLFGWVIRPPISLKESGAFLTKYINISTMIESLSAEYRQGG